MLTPEYMAGFFDGEGSVYAFWRRASTPRPSPSLSVCISNTNYRVLELHRDQFGGTLQKRKHRPGHQELWQWVCCARMCVPFLEAIYPHLIIKREVVETALKYAELMRIPQRERMDYTNRVYRRGRYWSAPVVKPEFREKVLKLHERIQALNARGAPYNVRREHTSRLELS